MILKPIGMVRVLLTTIVLGVSLVATALPARAITGGTEDVENTYSNVGMIVLTAGSAARGRSSLHRSS